MKLKIISDGTPAGTKVINQETGEIVENVRAINWHIHTKATQARMDIEIMNPEVEIEGEINDDS